jgi:hypothetical protein
MYCRSTKTELVFLEVEFSSYRIRTVFLVAVSSWIRKNSLRLLMVCVEHCQWWNLEFLADHIKFVRNLNLCGSWAQQAWWYHHFEELKESVDMFQNPKLTSASMKAWICIVLKDGHAKGVQQIKCELECSHIVSSSIQRELCLHYANLHGLMLHISGCSDDDLKSVRSLCYG